MLLNNLGRGRTARRPGRVRRPWKAARNVESFRLIVKALKDLRDDETLLVQSGKPVGILPTHRDAAARSDQ